MCCTKAALIFETADQFLHIDFESKLSENTRATEFDDNIYA